MTTPGRDGGRLQLEPIRKRLSRGQYRTLPPETTEGDIAYLLARCDALETALREKVAEWHGMRALAEAEGPIVGDEIGHASRWEMARIFTDELRALLSAEPPASKEEQ